MRKRDEKYLKVAFSENIVSLSATVKKRGGGVGWGEILIGVSQKVNWQEQRVIADLEVQFLIVKGLLYGLKWVICSTSKESAIFEKV